MAPASGFLPLTGPVCFSFLRKTRSARRKPRDHVLGKPGVSGHPIEDASGGDEVGWRVKFSDGPFVQDQDPGR